jgi:hypothetical protein
MRKSNYVAATLLSALPFFPAQAYNTSKPKVNPKMLILPEQFDINSIPLHERCLELGDRLKEILDMSIPSQKINETYETILSVAINSYFFAAEKGENIPGKQKYIDFVEFCEGNLIDELRFGHPLKKDTCDAGWAIIKYATINNIWDCIDEDIENYDARKAKRR